MKKFLIHTLKFTLSISIFIYCITSIANQTFKIDDWQYIYKKYFICIIICLIIIESVYFLKERKNGK